jgi:hypothetical protein
VTFIYTFGRDTSPLHLSATFQASQDAVATGLLTMRNGQPTDNILTDQPHYILYQGTQCPIFWINFPVDPKSGEPLVSVPGGPTTVAASVNYYTQVQVDGGVTGGSSEIDLWQYGDPVAQYFGSFGQWAVSYSIPEPSAGTLLLLGFGTLTISRINRRAHRKPQTSHTHDRF